MPRKVAFKVRAIDELYRQLRYVPPETRQRQMDAAEKLIHEIDPARNYPESFIIFRITGYRPESAADEATLVGEALVPDLTNLVLRLSEHLSIAAVRENWKALTMEDVASTLNVAPKSIQRYRRRGLVVHSVIFPGGVRKLGCFEDALERFITQHPQIVTRAAAFSRVDEGVEQQIIDEARRYRTEKRLSLNAAARQLSGQHGRAHETVRQILLRHDRASDQPIFSDHGPLSDRDARLMYRAWRRGVPVQTLADRFNRTPATVHRTVNRRRAAQLATFDLRYVHLPTFARDDADAVILSASVTRRGLNNLLPLKDALEFLRECRDADRLTENDEASLVACYNFLKKRAADALAGLPQWPGAQAVDEIETSLRWASSIKRRLVSAGLPAAIAMIQQHVGSGLERQPSEKIRTDITLAVDTVSRVTESIDPSKSQRMERLCRYAIAREMAKRREPDAPMRAAARHVTGTVALTQRHYARLNEWSELLDLPEQLAVHAEGLPESNRTLITRRYGLDGEAPRSCAEMASELSLTETAVRRRLDSAMTALRQLRRERGSGRPDP